MLAQNTIILKYKCDRSHWHRVHPNLAVDHGQSLIYLFISALEVLELEVCEVYFLKINLNSFR